MPNEFFDRNDGKSDNNDAYDNEYHEQMDDEDNMVEDHIYSQSSRRCFSEWR